MATPDTKPWREAVFQEHKDLFAILGLGDYPVSRNGLPELPPRRSRNITIPMLRETAIDQFRHLATKLPEMRQLSRRGTISLFDLAEAGLLGVRPAYAILPIAHYHRNAPLSGAGTSQCRREKDAFLGDLRKFGPDEYGIVDNIRRLGATNMTRVLVTLGVFDATKRFTRIPGARIGAAALRGSLGIIQGGRNAPEAGMGQS